MIFQASYNQSTVPKAWLQADVVLVFQKCDPAFLQADIYLSLTSISYHLMEHIMQFIMMRHLDENSILQDAQDVFRPIPIAIKKESEFHAGGIDKISQRDGFLLDFS